MKKSDFIKSLQADIGKTASDLDIFDKLDIPADNWCVDYGHLKFKQFGIEKYLYNPNARDVGAVSEAFFPKGRLISREKEPKVGDIMITTNKPNSRSWRTDLYGIYMPDLSHYTIITDLSRNNEANGYVIGAIGGNQGSEDIDRSKVAFTWWDFPQQAVYCSVDWDAIEQGSDTKVPEMIDVSECQDKIDWAKVKKAGVKYAIIRIGYGDLAKQKDSCFEYNYKNAKANGIKVGGYWVCYCGDDSQIADYVEDAKLEAKVCLSIIKGKTFDLPIFHDLEVKSTQTKKIHNATMAFCNAITEGGYQAGVYASNDFFDAYCDYKVIKSRFFTWVSQWGTSKCSKSCNIWQYSQTGKVNGINTTVDFNKVYSLLLREDNIFSWRTMGKGYDMREGQIKDVQRILYMCGYTAQNGTKLAVSGRWDEDTIYAVKCWQIKHGYAPTGILRGKCLGELLSSDY